MTGTQQIVYKMRCVEMVMANGSNNDRSEPFDKAQKIWEFALKDLKADTTIPSARKPK